MQARRVKNKVESLKVKARYLIIWASDIPHEMEAGLSEFWRIVQYINFWENDFFGVEIDKLYRTREIVKRSRTESIITGDSNMHNRYQHGYAFTGLSRFARENIVSIPDYKMPILTLTQREKAIINLPEYDIALGRQYGKEIWCKVYGKEFIFKNYNLNDEQFYKFFCKT